MEKEKDLDAIRYVLTYVKASHKYSKEFRDSVDASPRKWKKPSSPRRKEAGSIWAIILSEFAPHLATALKR